MLSFLSWHTNGNNAKNIDKAVYSTPFLECVGHMSKMPLVENRGT